MDAEIEFVIDKKSEITVRMHRGESNGPHSAENYPILAIFFARWRCNCESGSFDAKSVLDIVVDIDFK